ncbi:phosphate ABC transporter permease PstA [Prolixibacter sp. NT017]|uniref:phosphate ABC transporter permease PstA n=1 Tax=Prolixibacter sp. NT017 TaxID=2652390 RepID=UPI001275CCF6|nr:phosphate ABC transporter permease PstA [Prolixibacter sp. NT017]GET25497.1 phosphate transport system permease protein PstA [Prolixibacter sp. NT017]
MRTWKVWEQRLVRGISFLAAYSVIFILLFLLFVVFSKGLKALSWETIFRLPKGGYYFGGEGGILNAIVGSFYLSVGATVLAVIIGVPAALFINVQLIRLKRTQNTIRYLLDALWGIPSIVYGAFGFTLMLLLGLHASLLAGIITVALLITPILVRAFDEVLKTIPVELQEASFSLGSTKTETALRVIFKQGLAGFITALLLAFGRGIGDAASVLFTAGYTDNIPVTLDEPVATLPLSIFFQLSSPIEEVRERAYAAAVVLTFFILLISVSARFLSKRYAKNIIK